jgi:hypothetical protein
MLVVDPDSTEAAEHVASEQAGDTRPEPRSCHVDTENGLWVEGDGPDRPAGGSDLRRGCDAQRSLYLGSRAGRRQVELLYQLWDER